jgi:hypothetical protein
MNFSQVLAAGNPQPGAAYLRFELQVKQLAGVD